MKKLTESGALRVGVLLFACPWACAQGIPMGFDVFAEFGPSCLYGNVHSGASGEAKCEAGRLFAGARLRLSRHDAFEASYSYSPNVFDEAYPLQYENWLLYSHSFDYVRYLSTDPHFQPFVTGGVGWESFQGSAGLNKLLTTSVSQFAWNYGAGIDVVPQRHFALRFECRDYVTGIPHYHTSALHNIVPSIGIVFRFHRDRKL